MIKRTSLGEYNFEKYKIMRIKDVEGNTIKKRCIKEVHNKNREAKKYVQFQGGVCFTLWPFSLEQLRP